MSISIDKLLTWASFGAVQVVFVKEGTNQVVTQFGQYSQTLKPGLRWFISLGGTTRQIHKFAITDTETNQLIETTEVDMREIVYDYPKERVISRDNVQFEVNAVIYFRVFDPYKALFSVSDYTASLRKLVQSILRAEIGKHDLEETYSNRIGISRSLTEEADKATDDWGIRVVRLEIKEFELGDFAEQLLRQKQQDIEKRQQILHAQGLREAKIHEAEGQKEFHVQVAEGKKLAAKAEAEAIKIRAEAEAEAKKMQFEAESYGYEVIAKVMQSQPQIVNYFKYHTAETVSQNLSQGQATKLFLPNSMDQLVSTFSVMSDVMAESRTMPTNGNGSHQEVAVEKLLEST